VYWGTSQTIFNSSYKELKTSYGCHVTSTSVYKTISWSYFFLTVYFFSASMSAVSCFLNLSCGFMFWGVFGNRPNCHDLRLHPSTFDVVLHCVFPRSTLTAPMDGHHQSLPFLMIQFNRKSMNLYEKENKSMSTIQGIAQVCTYNNCNTSPYCPSIWVIIT